VAWVRRQGNASALNRTSNVWVGIYNSAAQAVTAPAVMTTSEPDSKLFDNPMLTHLSSGLTLMLVDRYDMIANQYALMYRVINESGAPQGSVQALAGINGYKADAFEMVNGKILIGWTNYTDYRVGYAVLNPNYTFAATPEYLSNPDGLMAAYISVTGDRAGYGILTWMDNELYSRVYYALVDVEGALLTPPMGSYPVSPGQAYVFSSTTGMGNAPNELIYFSYLPLIQR
jgi:hypothetical protein